MDRGNSGRGACALRPQPSLQHGNDVRFFRLFERTTTGDPVPFSQAATAAGGSGVLGDKDGMPAKRCLLAVVCRLCRGEALVDKVARVIKNDGQAFALKIELILRPEPEPPPEW
jgi:hypothetical protein